MYDTCGAFALLCEKYLVICNVTKISQNGPGLKELRRVTHRIKGRYTENRMRRLSISLLLPCLLPSEVFLGWQSCSILFLVKM